ncbi:hypothetical protein L1887_59270 [Cichorium endivia]|nr:hypothetical protein L1887_59270 [Cichorium endivia]
MALGATCVQKLDGSRDSAIHTKYRILLRSSSMRVSRDIRCRRVVCDSKEATDQHAHRERDEVGRILLICCFPWHIPCRGLLWCRIKIHGTPNGATTNISRRVVPAIGQRPIPLTPGYRYMFTGSFCFAGFDNDPSAGSPTETLLRLLLPLNDKVQWNSRDVARRRTAHVAAILTLHRTIQSVGATGGVYKGQGRSQRELMTRAY